MKRSEFLRMCGLLGIGIPLQSTLMSCNKDPLVSSTERVVIIGAGAGGMTAAYLLNQQGIDVQILEASGSYGGRMKRTSTFADFPIPLGAEWLHVGRGVFDEIINDPAIQADIQTTPYDMNEDYALYEGQMISLQDVGFTIDQKFIDATWFDFYETFVVPSISDKILYNKVVNTVDYSGSGVIVSTDTEQFEADVVIVAVPIKIMQSGTINFTPSLPNDKIEALQEVTVWDGCKAFIKFSEKFYPAVTAFDIFPETAGQKLYYDASYGQNSDQHVLGLFAVGTGTLPYVQLSDQDLIDYMLNELDGIFNGQATPNYIDHIFQNWNQEPFAQGAYVYDHEDWRKMRTLGDPVGDKLFFAGDGYSDGEDWSSVHAAARSAIRTVQELTG